MREERGARVARGAAVAGAATFVASLAHTLGGGLAPGPVAVALALAFSVPFSIFAVGGRRPSGQRRHGKRPSEQRPSGQGPSGQRFALARAGFAAVAAQLTLHALYSLGSGVPGTVVMQQTDASGPGLHTHHAAVATWASALPAAASAQSLHAADHVDHFGPWMLLAHAVAAVVTIGAIWLTAHAVSVLAAAARGIRIAIDLVGAALAPRPLAARPVFDTHAAPSLRDRHLLSWRHRGPPFALAAA